MEHADHVRLLRDGVPGTGGERAVWADLGAGTGAFTLALAELLGPGATIYAVDRDAAALRRQERAMRARFPRTAVRYVVGDLARPAGLALPPLDGVVMANVLHFFRDKAPLLAWVRDALEPGGRLLLVEYNADRGNPWVPYPLSYATWAALAARSGLDETRLLARQPSRFLGEIYSALSCKEK